MSDADRLAGYVEVWAGAVDDIVSLLRGLSADDWHRPTDLPGWDVHDVAAHLAHLESELAGDGLGETGTSRPGNATRISADYTATGPLARRGQAPEQVVAELEQATAKRLAALRKDPPTDGSAPASPPLGGLGWDWTTLLSNRIVDVWMHDQDVRRAVGLPGGLDTPGAAHTTGVFLRAFGFVVGKRVAPPAGTTIVLDVTGPQAALVAVEVGADGRAVPLREAPDHPTVRLTMGSEAYLILSGGRRPVDRVEVHLEGDPDLAGKVLAALAVTP